MKPIGALLPLFLLPFFFGCSSVAKPSDDTEQRELVVRAMQAIQAKYAPDPRLTIFNITPVQNGSSLLLKGEVENPEAKAELVNTFRRLGINAIDRINVLPSPELGERTWGIVRLSVANVRDDPAHAAEMGTQVLLGHVVRFWKKDGGWCLVQSSDRYLGWTEGGSFIPVSKDELNAWNSAKRVIVTAFADRIWEKADPGADTLPVSDVTTGALLKDLGDNGDWKKVELPDGKVGYIALASVTDYDQWRESRVATADNIELSAKWLLGLPYLWGGTSTKGMDCSGFTKTVFFLNGIQLMRNASHQSRQGTDVPLDPEFRSLKKGDLLFFGSKGDGGRPERISHVGIYLGNKQFIHASTVVQINSLDPKSDIFDERRLKGLVRVRRYLPE